MMHCISHQVLMLLIYVGLVECGFELLPESTSWHLSLVLLDIRGNIGSLLKCVLELEKNFGKFFLKANRISKTLLPTRTIGDLQE